MVRGLDPVLFVEEFIVRNYTWIEDDIPVVMAGVMLRYNIAQL